MGSVRRKGIGRLSAPIMAAKVPTLRCIPSAVTLCFALYVLCKVFAATNDDINFTVTKEETLKCQKGTLIIYVFSDTNRLYQ